MIKTLKKFSKKSIACIIAVLMVFSTMPFTAIAAQAADTSALLTAMQKFEEKMDGSVYTNMDNAYSAYVAASKAYDAAYYGGDTNIDVTTPATNLNNAVSQMTKTNLTVYTGTAKARFSKDTSDISAARGLLYSQQGVTYNSTTNTAYFPAQEVESYKYYGTSVEAELYHAPTVVLYDGTEDAKIPVISYVHSKTWGSSGVGKARIYAITLSNSNYLSLQNSAWKGGDDYGQAFNTIYGKNDTNVSSSNNDTYVEWNHRNGAGIPFNNYDYFANLITVSNTKLASLFSDNTYSKKIPNATWNLYANGAKHNNAYNGSQTQSDNTPIYVVNYKPLKDAITVDANKSARQNVASYKEGGMSTYLTGCVLAASLNPNTYTYSTDLAGQVSKCASDISTAVTKFKTAPTADNTNNYPKLRSAMDHSGTLPNFVSEGNSTQFTVRGAYNNGTNPGTFSEETYSAFKTAYENAQSTMSTVYSSGYKKGSEAAANATALLNAFNALELSNYRVNFSTIDDFISSNITRTVTVEKGGKVNSSDFPTITATAYSSNNKHNRYYWQNMTNQTEFTSQTVVNSDLDVVETKVEEACSIVNKGIKDDKVNLECSVCKHASTLNASAYKAAVLAAQASIANSQAYSQASRDALISVLSVQETAISEAKTQQEVDNCTSAIVSANQLQTDNNPAGKLVYNQYSITLNYVDEKSEVFETETITKVDYGTIKDVIAKTTFKDKDNKDKDYVVYKWTRSTQDGDKLLGLNSTSVSVNVIGNLTYYVHLKSTQAESSTDTAVVTLNNKAGKPVDVGYVTTNEAQDVVVNGNTIRIGTNTTLTAPQYSFYSVKGFIVNKELITAESGTKSITVTDDMTIIPLYSPKSYVNITRGDGEMFTINGKDTKSYSARWDELITLETTGDVIWYTTKNGSEVVLGQGKIFKFRANENIEIYTKQVGDSLTPNSRVGYFGYDADLKKVTIVNNFFVPGGANEDVKAGVVVSTKAKTREEMIAQYNAGSLKFEGGYDKFTADKNQIRITINRNGTGTRDFSMWALSYVIVGETTYFANDVISYTYNSQSTTA